MSDRINIPYKSFEEIQFNNDESLNFAYFNSHIKKMFANLDSVDTVEKLPVASDRNYGLVRTATVDDIVNHTNGDSVLPFNVFQEFLRSQIDSQRKLFTNENKLSINKKLELVTGELTVPSGFYVGYTVSNTPSRVLYANVTLEVPGMASGNSAYEMKDVDSSGQAKRFFTCSESIDLEKYPTFDAVDAGKIWFERPESTEIKNEKHVQAYYKDGVVVVRNQSFSDNRSHGTATIRVRWTLIQKSSD